MARTSAVDKMGRRAATLPQLCDADYVGYTHRHLFQRVDKHKHSAIGKHLRDVHNQTRIKMYVTNLPSRNAVESWIA